MSNNKKVDDYINEYFNKKGSVLGVNDLFRMIEEAMDVVEAQPESPDEQQPTEVLSEEQKFDASKFMSTALAAYQVPSEQAGKFGTKERKDFQFHVTKQIRGKTLSEKIKSLNKFVSGAEVKKDAKISTILSHCGTLSILSKMIEDFNPSAAGFAFEAFIAALLQGEQIADPAGGSLPIEDAVIYMDNPSSGSAGTPISLKLLNTTGAIKGSIENLLTFLGETEAEDSSGSPYIVYIVGVKHTDKYLGFYSFNVSTDSFFDWVKPSYFDFKKIKIPSPVSEAKDTEQDLEVSPKELKAIEAKVESWKNKVSLYFKYWGFEESKNPDSTDYQKFIPKPAAKKPEAASELIRTAIPAEEALRDSGFFKERKGLWFTEDEIEKFENKTISGEELNVMMKKMRDRRSIFVGTIAKDWGPGPELSTYHIVRLNRILSGAPEKKKLHHTTAKKMEYLNKLLSEERYKEWATVLKSVKKKEQFTIQQMQVRDGSRMDTDTHGSLIVDSKSVEDLLKTYSEKLLESCAPIYEALGALTDNINRFFLGSRTDQKSRAAYGASEDAKQLSIHTDKLAQENKQEG